MCQTSRQSGESGPSVRPASGHAVRHEREAERQEMPDSSADQTKVSRVLSLGLWLNGKGLSRTHEALDSSQH